MYMWILHVRDRQFKQSSRLHQAEKKHATGLIPMTCSETNTNDKISSGVYLLIPYPLLDHAVQ